MFNKVSSPEFPWTRAQQRKTRKKKAIIGIGLASAAVATVAGAVTKEHNRP